MAMGGFLGYFFSKKYRKRKQFFVQIFQFNERFLAEIGYYKRPLTKFITAYPYKGEFDVLLQYYYQLLHEDAAGARKTFQVDKEEMRFLTVDELTFLGDYFQTLGKGDTTSQKAYFSAAQTQLGDWKNKSEVAAKKYGDLYVKLGVLMGLAVLIFII